MNQVITKELYLLRHAKSSWDDPTARDHDRPLNPRGQRAARSLAEYFRRAAIRPQLVLCSAAARAVQTLAPISAVMGFEDRTRIEPDLYGAAAEEILARVRAVDDGVDSVMVVGHNPGLQDLVFLLGGDDPEIAGQRWERFPTGALAEVVSNRGAWSDLSAGTARVVSVTVPRDLQK